MRRRTGSSVAVGGGEVAVVVMVRRGSLQTRRSVEPSRGEPEDGLGPPSASLSVPVELVEIILLVV
jgi:hypothetical protein